MAFCRIFGCFGRDLACISGRPDLATFGAFWAHFLASEGPGYVSTLADLQVVLEK